MGYCHIRIRNRRDMGINRNRSKGNIMDAKDIMEIDEGKMWLLMKMKDWFIKVEQENTRVNLGTYIYWSSTMLKGSISTKNIVDYIDDIIDRGWYSDTSHKDILNWMRELYIVNGMGYNTISPITTI